MSNILIIGSENFDRYSDIEDFMNKNYSKFLFNSPNVYTLSQRGVANCIYHYFRYHHIPNFKLIQFDNKLKKNILKEIDTLIIINNIPKDNTNLVKEAERKKKINILNFSL